MFGPLYKLDVVMILGSMVGLAPTSADLDRRMDGGSLIYLSNYIQNCLLYLFFFL